MTNQKKYQIIFARHAKAKHNVYNGQDTFAGQRRDTNLTEEGEQEAKELARKILNNFPPDLIFHSRLARSRQTAEIIADEISKITAAKPSVKKIDGLEEVDVGDFTRLGKTEALERDKKAAEAFYNNDIENFNFPNGENYASLQRRVKLLISNFNDSIKPGQKAIAVGHSMFNRVIFYELFKNETKLYNTLDHPHDLLVNLKGPLEYNEEKNDRQ